MSDRWAPPEGHPISEAQARKLIGVLGAARRQFIASCQTREFSTRLEESASALDAEIERQIDAARGN